MGKVVEEKKRLFAFDVLKLIAVLLILNSHFDLLYPEKLRVLATGGTWGNTIFFAVSGYFTRVESDFVPYMRKKVIRLYPSVLIFTFITVVLQLRNVVIENAADLIAEFIWPTYYWFVGALVLFYIVLYLLERRKIVSSRFPVFTAAFWGILLLYYGCCIADKNVWCMEKMGFASFEGWLKVLYYFYVFALGYFLMKNSGICRKISAGCSAVSIIFGALGYMGYKLLLVKAYIPMRFQILAPVFACFLAMGALCLTLSYKKNGRDGKTSVEKVVTCLSSLSLEMYLVQFTVIHFFEGYLFPLNMVMASAASFALAYILKKFSSYLVGKVTAS